MADLYDVCVVGGGLSGQLIAQGLSKKGFSVVLVEAQDKLGGRCQFDTPLESIYVPYGFLFNFFTKELAQKLQLKGLLSEVSNQVPQTFQKMKWRDASLEELSVEQKHFYLSEYLWPQEGFLKNLNAEIDVALSCPMSFSHIKDNLIEDMANNEKSFHAKAFVMATPSKALLSIFGKDVFHKKFLKALQAQESFHAVKLDFVLTSKVSELKNIILPLDPFGVGLFSSNIDSSLSDAAHQLSQWLFFLTSEELNDKEEIAKKMRAGKRFIKKAFPEFFNEVAWEKIGVVPHVFSKSPIELPTEWTQLKNLFWISDEQGMPSPEGNPICQQVLKTISSVESFLT